MKGEEGGIVESDQRNDRVWGREKCYLFCCLKISFNNDKIAAAASTASPKSAQEKDTKLVPRLPSRLTKYVQSQAKELKDDVDKRYKAALKEGTILYNS